MALRLLILAVGFLLGVPGAAADEPAAQPITPETCPICRRANDPRADPAARSGSTFLRGVTNTAFGWTELIQQPVKEVEGGHTVRNVLTGIAKGAGRSVTRTASGIGELFTFWVRRDPDRDFRLANDCPICMGNAPAKRP